MTLNKNLCMFFCSLLEQLAAIPEFQGLGPLFKSSPEPEALTELETEYVIYCTKHTFSNHMVFQVGGVEKAFAQLISLICWNIDTYIIPNSVWYNINKLFL